MPKAIINNMNREQQISNIHHDLDEAINKVLEKHGHKKISSRVKYSEEEFTLTLKAIVSSLKPLTTNDQTLRNGFAEPGTIAYVSHKGRPEKVRILSKARTKYSFEFVDSPELNHGGTWRGHFRGFSSSPK